MSNTNDYEWSHHYELAKEMYNCIAENHVSLGEKNYSLSRNVIHLIYYACYHYTLLNNEKYECKSTRKGGASSHEENINQILKYKTEESDVDLKRLKSDMVTLKDYRIQADYNEKMLIDYYTLPRIFSLGDKIYDDLIELYNN